MGGAWAQRPVLLLAIGQLRRERGSGARGRVQTGARTVEGGGSTVGYIQWAIAVTQTLGGDGSLAPTLITPEACLTDEDGSDAKQI